MRLSTSIVLVLAVALTAGPARADCMLGRPATYQDVQTGALSIVVDRFADRFCGAINGRDLRACFNAHDGTAVIFDVDLVDGTSIGSTVLFTYSFETDPLGTTEDDRREWIGFIVGLDAVLADSQVKDLRLAKTDAVRFALVRTRHGETVIDETLHVGPVSFGPGLRFVDRAPWTIPGVGWRRGGDAGNATPTIRQARDASEITHATNHLRQLGRYLCDVRGTPWHFRMPGK
ncbi:MAG: hypothetical protein RIE23_07775 [Pontimonas sp.]